VELKISARNDSYTYEVSLNDKWLPFGELISGPLTLSGNSGKILALFLSFNSFGGHFRNGFEKPQVSGSGYFRRLSFDVIFLASCILKGSAQKGIHF